MTKFKKFKQKNKDKLLFPILIAGLFLVFALMVVSNLKINQKRKELNLKVKSLKNKVEELERKREELRSKIFQTKTEDYLDYLEKIAREELNLKREGERVAAFPIIEQEVEENKANKKENFLQKILEKFKFKK